MKTRTVLIGIQARSSSKRFPNKMMAALDGKPVIEHVISTCLSVRDYLSKSKIESIDVQVALLVPWGDPLKSRFENMVRIIEGPEDDVLTRYWNAYKSGDYDFVARITGDCPLIPSFVIVKHIKCAVAFDADYVSNVDPMMRTEIDGWDCEVLSREALSWLNDNAKEQEDREHVTTLIRQIPPRWAKIGHVIGFVDRSSIKLSVDTIEDLERVSEQMANVKNKIAAAYASRKHLVWRL